MDRKVRGWNLRNVDRLRPRLTNGLKGYLAMLSEISSDKLTSCPWGGLHLFAKCYRNRRETPALLASMARKVYSVLHILLLHYLYTIYIYM